MAPRHFATCQIATATFRNKRRIRNYDISQLDILQLVQNDVEGKGHDRNEINVNIEIVK